MNAPPAETQAFFKLPRGLAPLGYKNFALYWIGVATTNTGRWIELTGLVWLVYELTHSPFLLGFLGLARAIPAIVLSPIAGVVSDRANQRRLLFVTQGLGLVASFVLGVLVATGLVELWHVYLQVAIQAAITSFDSAIRQALFPRLVPRAHLAKAVMLSITASRCAKLIGPAVGGVVIAGLGEAAPFLLNATSFLALMAAVVAMPSFARIAMAAPSFRRELLEGLRHMMTAPVMSGLFKMEIVYGIFDMNPVIITIIGRETLKVGPQALGLLLSAPALGSIIGIVWLLFLHQTARQGRFSLSCTIGYGVMFVFFALSWNYVLSFVVLALVGILDVVVTVTRSSIMQLAAPEAMRGRIMANLGTVTRGIGPIAETQSGIVAGIVGPQLAVITAGAALAIAAGFTARVNPTLWRFSTNEASSHENSEATRPNES